jgi:5-(carboxyamino)imidazole ribonucleotide synthase
VLLNASDAQQCELQAKDILDVVRGIWPVFPSVQD